MRLFTHTLILGSMLLLASCGSAEEKAAPTPTQGMAPTTTADTGHGHNQGAQPTTSMSLSLAGVTLDIAAKGTLRPNAEYRLEMALVSGEPGAIVRVWIGDESGTGSMKTKADGHGDHYHGHALVPKEISEKTALWIEVQSVTGEREVGRIALQ
ncbi:MAG: hypothetical protein HOC27_01680 [Phycisphaerae bacterium]|jgi:hypothetical protein|nr:hypothetical protein [Phycisphaerae bacterium]